MWLLSSIATAALLVQVVLSTSHVRHVGIEALEQADTSFVPLEKWLQQRNLHGCLTSQPADILFAVDASQSVGSSNFHFLMKSILVDTISKFKIGQEYTQVGVLVFSDQVSQVLPIGRFNDKLQLLDAVSGLRFVNSFTSMEAAVEGCSAELHRRHMELRERLSSVDLENHKTVVVFLTDGWDTHGSTSYMKDILTDMRKSVTGILALGLQRSNEELLDELATAKDLVFNPTTFPEFQSALLNLLNSRCAHTCNKYLEQQKQTDHSIDISASYINTVVANYVQLIQQQLGLQKYVQQVNASTEYARQNMRRTCGKDETLLAKIKDLGNKIKVAENSTSIKSEFIGIYEANMTSIYAQLQSKQFEMSRKLVLEEVKLASRRRLKTEMISDMESMLSSKRTMLQARVESIKRLEQRIAKHQQMIMEVDEKIRTSTKFTEEVTEEVIEREEVYEKRLAELKELLKEQLNLRMLNKGSTEVLDEIKKELAFCNSYLRNKENVLFAIRCGSGADFSSFFSLEESTFSKTAFTSVNESLPMYKSPYLRHMHEMGYFKDAALQFIIDGSVVATLDIDTSRFELADIFSKFYVRRSFPYVASYINSIYRAELSHFRLRHTSKLLMLFGDMSKYLETSKCSDLKGVFIVIGAPHPCYKEVDSFPQVFIADSPYGGNMRIRVTELRLVTRQVPDLQLQMPNINFTRNVVQETLLFVRAGAGPVAPKLLTDYSSSASVLLNIKDMQQLKQHYKSSLFTKLDVNLYDAITIKLFSSSKQMLARLVFKGPFRNSWHTHHSAGVGHESWMWFRSEFLAEAEPFDLQQMKRARFEVYDGKQLLSIGMNMASNCESRRYFLTISDGAETECSCFRNVQPPAIFFAEGKRPTECKLMQQASSLLITGTMRNQMGPESM